MRSPGTVSRTVVPGASSAAAAAKCRGSGSDRVLQSQSSLAHNPSLRLRMLVPADDRTRRVLAGAVCVPA